MGNYLLVLVYINILEIKYKYKNIYTCFIQIEYLEYLEKYERYE